MPHLGQQAMQNKAYALVDGMMIRNNHGSRGGHGENPVEN